MYGDTPTIVSPSAMSEEKDEGSDETPREERASTAKQAGSAEDSRGNRQELIAIQPSRNDRSKRNHPDDPCYPANESRW